MEHLEFFGCFLLEQIRKMDDTDTRKVSSSKHERSIYHKPSHGGIIDDEYVNKFVGLSVPILQGVTIVYISRLFL
jgi:hypothetical protein